MRKMIGIGCVLSGLLCLLIAAGFVVHNRDEAKKGAEISQVLLKTVQTNIQEASEPENGEGGVIPEKPFRPVYTEMPTLPAGNYESIGILSIPVLELELPVLTEWSYEKLKSAPCHYYGSYYASDFVIAAHNYAAHFGSISQLQPGDLVMFTDVTGKVRYYEVVLLETLAATATEEMIASGFDLSLYTCTPGGSNRVTVRCRAVIGNPLSAQ